MTAIAQSASNETFVLNLGPQHPATHGVLRVKLVMDGEYIVEAEPVLGYIHRMHEKMGENRTWAQFLPNTGRMDYLHALAYNHNYVCLVERAAGIEVPERAEYIRVITNELNRISSHLLWFGAFVLDLGGFSPLLYAFDDREQILDLLEAVTGSRLTYCYYRFGGVYNDVDQDFLDGSKAFVARLRERMPMYHNLVTKNIILMKRLQDIGFIDAEMCRKYGATGPVARGAGIDFDVRRHEPYSVYPRFDFDIPVYSGCDSMARYMVRMDEMEQSMRIIEQAVGSIPEGPVMAAKAPKTIKPPKGDYYHAVETARGSFGIRAVSDGTNTPYRMKLRTPSFSNLVTFGEAAKGMLLPDALALMGSLDLVIPEIDR
ncbi:NADH-quinone oxidoreductase subunit D [Fundidesulfovibrio soli]|uniref:NADH-quinone oxidoreductase subunit D n=1 Tax=Fundidesulfovibrio soli TaxID=2922716 RepID=UPI001FAFBB05|nr:NADH-quinone oxidoreductase subunit D [Fundidesulfovibrio soli]